MFLLSASCPPRADSVFGNALGDEADMAYLGLCAVDSTEILQKESPGLTKNNIDSNIIISR